jgi:PST family polysaccharide transporter
VSTPSLTPPPAESTVATVAGGPLPSPPADAVAERGIATDGRTLRQHSARGTLINGSFLVGLTSLSLLKGYVVAGFLTREDYGIWGILVIGLGTISWLKGAGVGDKYVQQSEADQKIAFQKAFTMELLFTAGLVAVSAAAIPLLLLSYGRSAILLPAIAIVFLYLPTGVLQAPRWVFYRRMDFVRQRMLDAVEPVVAAVVTVALAVAGAGYWSLVIGAVAGGIIGGAVTLLTVPYPLAFRYERGTMREYVHFTWPLTLAGLAGLIIAQGALLVPNWVLGLSAVGIVSLASSISVYAQQLDQIVTDTVYPAICAVRDSVDLLFETFVKSNRIALMWGMPFGVGIALFAPDLVHFALGAQWIPAIGLIQIFGAVAAADQIGFNWTAFYRAFGDTRPILWATAVTSAAFICSVIPLTLWRGLTGFGWSMVIMSAAMISMRGFYLVRLFPGFNIPRHMVRAVLPTAPAVACILGARVVEGGPRSGSTAVFELVGYVAVTLIFTLLFERRLLRELWGYIVGRRPPAAGSVTAE